MHGARLRAARDFDAGLARAAVALTELLDTEPAYAEELRAAGASGARPNWSQLVTRAMWAVRSADPRWLRRWGTAGVPRPSLAMALGLPVELRARSETLAELLGRYGPPGPRADPLELQDSHEAQGE